MGPDEKQEEELRLGTSGVDRCVSSSSFTWRKTDSVSSIQSTDDAAMKRERYPFAFKTSNSLGVRPAPTTASSLWLFIP